LSQLTCKRCGKRLVYTVSVSGDGYGVGLYSRWWDFDDEDETCTDNFGNKDYHRPDRINQIQAIDNFVQWLDKQVKEESEANEWVEPA
jgi:hypothetical protein